MCKKQICGPILALFFISLGGLLLHLRIHPPAAEASNWLAIIIGIITTFALPFMFAYRKTAAWAYLINLAAVVIGTIAMAHYSFEHPPEEITVKSIILQTTLADILVLFAKIPLGQMLLGYWRCQKKENISSDTE